MNWRITRIALLLCLSLAACSKTNSSTSAQVPSPTDPSPAVTPTSNNNTPTTPTDPHAVDLEGAVSINLADKVHFQGLADITGEAGVAGNVFLPLVGDAKINLHVTNTRSTSIDGKLVLAFEDQGGFWEASWDNAFAGTGYHSGNLIDIIFADDDLVVRTVGVLSGDKVTGNIYYRLRAAGDTACKQVQTTCQWVYSNGNTVQYQCTNPPADTVTPCRNYMDYSSDSHVKTLGAFQTTYSALTKGQ